jgi:hypothetical protein
MRKFYKDVRNLTNLPTTMTLVCKDKTGTYYQKKKNKFWNDGKKFKELLNPDFERKNRIKPHEGRINNIELEEPPFEEINEIIKKHETQQSCWS